MTHSRHVAKAQGAQGRRVPALLEVLKSLVFRFAASIYWAPKVDRGMFLPTPRCVATTVHTQQRRPLRRVFLRCGKSFDAHAVDVRLIVIDTGHSRNGVHALCSLEGELPLTHLDGDPLYFRPLVSIEWRPPSRPAGTIPPIPRVINQHRRVGGAYGRGNDRIPICDVELYRCDPADIKAIDVPHAGVDLCGARLTKQANYFL